jgi:hypothetical protein
MRWKYWLVGGFALAVIVIIALLFWLGFAHESGSAPTPAHPASPGIGWLWPVLFVCLLAFAIGWAIGGKRGKVIQAVAAVIAIFAIGPIVWQSAGEWYHSGASSKVAAGTSGTTCLSQVVTTSRERAKWPMVTVPADGDSPLIPIPCEGTRAQITGTGYEIHVVYQDPRTPECVMGWPLPACRDHGKMRGVYLRDTTGVAHTEQYAYEISAGS